MENFEGDVSSVDSSSEQNFCLCFIQLISPVCLKLKVKWLNYKLKFVPVCLKLKVKWLNYKLKFVPVCPSLSQAKGQMAELQAQTNGRPRGRIVNLVLGR